MAALTTMVVLGFPVLLMILLLVDGPLARMLDRRDADRRVPDLRALPEGRLHRRAAARRLRTRRRLSTVDGRPTGLTVEAVGEVVPVVPIEPDERVTAAALAWVESRAVEANEHTLAYQAAAHSPVAQATAGTPLAEVAPFRIEDD